MEIVLIGNYPVNIEFMTHVVSDHGYKYLVMSNGAKIQIEDYELDRIRSLCKCNGDSE